MEVAGSERDEAEGMGGCHAKQVAIKKIISRITPFDTDKEVQKSISSYPCSSV